MWRSQSRPEAALARLLLLLGLLALCLAGLREPGPTIDGQPLAVCTLREGESRVFSCRAPRPAPGAMLAWYLDGQKQEANCSALGTASTLTLTARRSDRQLNCSLTDPASGQTYNASVLLNVQYKPEILQADAHYQEVEGKGLLLVLFVLVEANPPASITWVDQDGRVMANASEFLLLDTTHYPGLANHSLRIHLDTAAGNFSVSAANSLGVTTTSLLPPAALSSHSPRVHVCPARPNHCHPTCTSVTSCRRPEVRARVPVWRETWGHGSYLGEGSVYGSCPFPFLQLPPGTQELVLGARRAHGQAWRTPWSSASSVLSSSQSLGASTKCPV
ncbi:transmembrane protein 25 isoform X4 [Melopsittacus undulatus]|uniref:transmembrane protein 25 isoform X4 n=1 Tax=Melopsittacus undulatus TaxID=13146 RepID=UPI0012436FF2|nr:transmembrane protein 25 isoform X4 [Melopsittacus undulatus]